MNDKGCKVTYSWYATPRLYYLWPSSITPSENIEINGIFKSWRSESLTAIKLGSYVCDRTSKKDGWINADSRSTV